MASFCRFDRQQISFHSRIAKRCHRTASPGSGCDVHPSGNAISVIEWCSGRKGSMQTIQKIAAVVLLATLAAAGFGIVKLGHPSGSAANKLAAAAQAAVVDQTPLKTASALAQLADTPEEQELAKSALRLGDKESDLSFNIALQDTAAHAPELSPEAREIQKQLQKAQKLQTALQAQTNQLTA